jgi:dienelactone hydrolase
MKKRKILTNLFFGILTAVGSNLYADPTVDTRTLRLEFGGRTYSLDIYSQEPKPKKAQPGLVLLPEYWGKGDLEQAQARRLAERGYAVLVLDLYGNGKHTTLANVADADQEEAEAGGLDSLLELISESIKLFKKQSGVDSKRVGAIGLGYGGGLLLNSIRKNGPGDGLKAAVSFYGGTRMFAPLSLSDHVPPILYVRPGEDVFTTEEEFQAFKKQAATEKLDLQVTSFKDAYYGFIHPTIESYGGDDGKTFMYYDRKAAEAAWASVFRFLAKKL